MSIITVAYDYLDAKQSAELIATARKEKTWQKLTWGTRGPNGKGKVRQASLGDLATDHLEAILATQPHIGNEYRAAIMALLRERWIFQAMQRM
jgi:hypothetical protein